MSGILNQLIEVGTFSMLKLVDDAYQISVDIPSAQRDSFRIEQHLTSDYQCVFIVEHLLHEVHHIKRDITGLRSVNLLVFARQECHIYLLLLTLCYSI